MHGYDIADEVERKIYTITEKGREAFTVGLGKWMNITKCLERCGPMVEGCCG